LAQILLNQSPDCPSFADAFADLATRSHSLLISSSYIQQSGWNILERTRGVDWSASKIVYTDQFGITNPKAISAAIDAGLQVRRYSGRACFHPKVYLGIDGAGSPVGAIVGSANLSRSGFEIGVEAGVTVEAPGALQELLRWFTKLFDDSQAPSREELEASIATWKRLVVRRTSSALKGLTPENSAPLVEPDLGLEEALDSVFSTLHSPVVLLNMDYAGNNVRTISRVRAVLNDWERIARTNGKARNELKLLGLAHGERLTQLGEAARDAASNDEVAEIWLRGILRARPEELTAINGRLLGVSMVHRQFRTLKPNVQYFFKAASPNEKVVLQTIELLCNTDVDLSEFELEDIRALAVSLLAGDALPADLKETIHSYYENKGARGWTSGDRTVVTNAFERLSV
jgi:hypothetical protein